MGGSREYLHDDMILEATGPEDDQNALDAMTGLVYRCVKARMTIGEVIETSGLDPGLTHRIIGELKSLGFVRIAGHSDPAAPSGATRQPEAREPPQRESGEVSISTSYVEELDRLYTLSQKANYYELLGVDPETSRSEMRTRYFELSKRFHPDKAFGKALQDRKHKMSHIFQKLTEAYETLSNANKRVSYNATISEDLELWAIEKKLKKAMRESGNPGSPNPSMPPEAAKIARGFSSAPPGRASSSASLPSRGPTHPIASPSEPSGRRRTYAPGRRLSDNPADDRSWRQAEGSVSRPPQTAKFVPSVSPGPMAEARRQLIRRRRAGQAMADLLGRRSDGPAPPEVLNKLFDDAHDALAHERYRDAVGILRRILEISPDHPDATGMLETATASLARVQAQQHIRRGRFAKNQGEFDQAKWHFEQALASDEKNIDARHLLAEILVEQRTQLGRARELMKEVIILGGQRARYFATLGEVFLWAQEPDRAADAFARAIKLDPENKELKKRLRLCRK